MRTEKINGSDRLGMAALAIGLISLAIALMCTVLLIIASPQECKAPAAAPATNALVVVGDTSIRLGGGVCLGLNVPGYFKAARATARADEARRIRTLQIFFDDMATPATLTVDIDATGDTAEPWNGWSWARVPLRPATAANSDSGRKWRDLLTSTGPVPQRQLRIGLADKPEKGDAKLPRSDASASIPVTLNVYDPALTALGGFGLLLTAVAVVRLFWNTGLLRASAPSAGVLPPFSLGRVQMAFWLLLSVAGFLAIWLITGIRSNVITGGLLTLLGISAGSGLAARLIDSGSPDRPTVPSQGFWRDILSENYDTSGAIAVHRLQMVVWTIVLALIFVWTVLSTFALPDFDTNLLLLIGISSSTYVGFKFPESKKVDPGNVGQPR